MAALLPQGQAPLLASAALCVPWVLSGVPQIVESLCMAASGVLNTHVLMALAALGTLYMGMPQEVGVRAHALCPRVVVLLA